MKIKIATSQFPVSAQIESNRDYILQQMQEARQEGCDLIQFPECSLSGYAGVDFPSFQGYDWALLKFCTLQVMEAAKKLRIWVLVGSSHPLSGDHKPHNSLFIINEQGEIVDRYDKRFVAGDPAGDLEELGLFSPGNHFSIFELNGIRCSVLICHEYRYPELYRELKKRGVQIVFHSFHAGNMEGERKQMMEAPIREYRHLNPGSTYPEITMPATMISYAANNYLWISCSNTSAPESCWASFVVRPDGVTVGKLEKNKPGILTTEIDSEEAFYDSTRAWRNRAIQGVFYSGKPAEDSRTENRKEL